MSSSGYMKSFFFKAVGIQKFHIHIHMNIVMFTLWCGAEPVISLRFVCICVHIYSWLCSVLSRVWLFATPWTVARQAPLPIGFSRQGYCGGLLFSSPKNLPDPGTELGSPALQEYFFLPFESPIYSFSDSFLYRLLQNSSYFVLRSRTLLIIYFINSRCIH